jgi:hypothetical protein
MKLNWGHKLVFFAGAFMVFIIVLVYRISMQKIDLVDENYYENGIRYQDEINKFALGATVHPSILIDTVNKQLTFTADAETILSGKLLLYRPSNDQLDFNVPFELPQGSVFVYSIAQLGKGPWKATFEWSLGGKLMASEKQFIIQ